MVSLFFAAITGYDFVELLANNGALLEQELGITRLMVKKKLLRGIKMKLLGMGAPPARPSIPVVQSMERDKCYTHVSLTWQQEPGEATGADAQSAGPVHRYQLQRQTLSSHAPSGQLQRSQWVTVYEGTDSFVEDTLFTPPTSVAKQLSGHVDQLSPPHVYSYRLCAWNLIGRSELVYLRLEVPGGAGSGEELVECESFVVQPFPSVPHQQPNPYLLANSNSVPLPSPSDVSAANTVSELSPPTSVWVMLWNALSMVVQGLFLGQSILLRIITFIATLLTVLMPWWRYENMRRYTSASNGGAQEQSNNFGDSSATRIARVIMGPLVSVMCPPMVGLCRFAADHVAVLHAPATALSDALQAFQKMASSHISEDDDVTPPVAIRQVSANSSGYCSSGDEVDYGAGDEGASYSTCSICSKNFKFRPIKLRWRKRHHCCRCLNVFCDDCGIVTHAKFLECPVPGSCECLYCAGIAQPPASLLVDGIAAPSNQPAGGAAVGVAVVSSTALAMHNRVVPSAESSFKHAEEGQGQGSAEGTASSDSSRDDHDSALASSARSSLRVHADKGRPALPRMNSSSSAVFSARSSSQGTAHASAQVSGRELAESNKVGNRSFGSIMSLMKKTSSRQKGADESSRALQEAGSSPGQSVSVGSVRKLQKGLPPKPPAASPLSGPVPGSSRKKKNTVAGAGAGAVAAGGGGQSPTTSSAVTPPVSPQTTHSDRGAEDSPGGYLLHQTQS
jgi:hypothetical protein